MLGDQPARFTGNVAWRATIPISALGEEPPPPTACVWVGRGRHAVSYRLRGGTVANFVGVVERSDWQAESWIEQGSAVEAAADFSGWHSTIHNMINNAKTLHRWALYDRSPLPRWHDGRVVLLGDSCHPMLPFLAQGSTMAMEDGLTLANALGPLSEHVTSPNTVVIDSALQRYFNQRIHRSRRVQAGARNNMRVFHQPALAYAPVQLATAIKPNLMHRRMDWLYSYEVPG